MYSGSDSNESQKYAQWALNPASFQNVPGDQVDWAVLAQQWIIMKESDPPLITADQPVVLNKKANQGGGEAEMDLENDKDILPPPVWGTSESSRPPGAESWNWNNQNQSWNWNNSWAPPVPPPAPNISGIKTPLLPTPNNSYNEPPEGTSDNAVPFGSQHINSNSSSQYWNNSGVPPKYIKPHNKRYSKVNVPIRASDPLPSTTVEQPTTTGTPSLDTAKRKQLPAWIREGLEKMEKEKLKQIEKEKEKEERESYVEQNKQPNKETIEILKTTMKERQRSRFESDGENSEDETKVKKRQKSPEETPLTHDEMILKVRRTMTEILLNVTNKQIEAVCREELQRFVKNRKASEAASAPSGATIRGRLGLSMYGGDDSGSSSDDDRDDHYYRSSRDSDNELKDIIRKKVADFQKTEREIENKLEEAEKRKDAGSSRSSSPESIDNDSQVDARNQDRKYHHHDSRRPSSSPKSPYEKQKHRSPSTSSEESEYSDNRSKTSRHSSSEESKDSYRRSRRSPTPEKRHRSTSARWSKSPSRLDSRRDSGSSRKKCSSRRSRSRSYSRSRRSRSSSYRRSKRSRSRERLRRSRSSSRSRYSKRSPSSSRSERRKRRRSRSESSSRGKRSHRH